MILRIYVIGFLCFDNISFKYNDILQFATTNLDEAKCFCMDNKKRDVTVHIFENGKELDYDDEYSYIRQR